MPCLKLQTPDGNRRNISLLKKITSLGRAPDNDIPLADPKVPEHALHIVFDGHQYTVGTQGSPFLVNGKKKDEHALREDDIIEIGDSHLQFKNEAPAASGQGTDFSDSHTTDVPGIAGRELVSIRKLTAISERLFKTFDLEQLLGDLMDAAIEVTRADKGFLILLENNELRVKIARNIERKNIEDAIERVSDSIVAKVIRTQKPLILSDALDDPEFSAAQSVVNLKLLSVMCVPLALRGDVFGLIYVGNDRLVNRFEPKSLDTLTIFAAQASLLLTNAMLVNELKWDTEGDGRTLEQHQYGEIIGACPGMKDLYKRIDKIAGTEISVLILGETGTGKELIAREIHQRSPRAKGPFITINCGAIPENLLESELFGHVKGAFTGAIANKPGKFHAAIGGSLFLDEIGEMPLQLQVKLLRALQEKIISRVGDNRPEHVDIRVIAATNKVLDEEVKKGTFREDLYYRLNVVTLRLPPLRERGDDLGVLLKYFLQKYAKEFSSKARGFTPAATIATKKYAWPGNIRELENRVKKAVVLADKPLLSPEDLDLQPENLEPIMSLAQAKEEFQKRYINEVLERNNGNRTKTAKDLGVDPRTVFRHLEKLEAEKTGQRPPPDELFEESA